MQQHRHHDRQPALPTIAPRLAPAPLPQPRLGRAVQRGQSAIQPIPARLDAVAWLVLAWPWLALICGLLRTDDDDASWNAEDGWRLNPGVPCRRKRSSRALQTAATCRRFPALQLDRIGGSLKSRRVVPRATPP
ncbi:hypothetical protein [Rhodanobacter terrae]|uniref:Uncharacterized protein n=1 Tax=Rhodanobacter terrae TaxID=418647 RepID=A0ABW0SZX7_9GAMM